VYKRQVNGSVLNFNFIRSLSTNTASSATDTNSSLYSAGGLAVTKNAYIGNNIFVGGNLVVTGSTISTEGNLKIVGTETGTTVNLDVTKTVIECTDAGTVTIILPVLNTSYKGREYYIISYSGSMSIVPNGSNLLNGSNTTLTVASSAYSKFYIIGGDNGWWFF
jgi:hypothetical protein